MDLVGVERWLQDLGLAQYAREFVENDIDLDVLPDLSEQDLEELGVSLGHRKKPLRAIAVLSADPDSSAPVPSTVAASDPRSPPRAEAERRQLTVLFCDLVGSTQLSARLEPEDMRDVIHVYQNTVSGEVLRFGGHIAKFMGDGILAYFGWPRAHEDAAERAVRAGLAAAGSVARLRIPTGDTLAARVGIATGVVIVGDLIGQGAAQEEVVVGDTLNLAARLQAAAEPGQVIVVAGTQRLLGDLFELEDLGPQILIGIGETVPAFVVCGERPAASRFEAREAGIGKSRLARARNTARLFPALDGLITCHFSRAELSAADRLAGELLDLAEQTEEPTRGRAGPKRPGVGRGSPRSGEKDDERWFEAEVHRLRGELSLSLSDPAEAEKCFLRAARVAQQQNAKMWQLRATMSLPRLWRDRGRRGEAHDLLAPVYDWFTEGFDMADLEDAKALLEELS